MNTQQYSNGGVREVKIDPITAKRPSNAEIARGVNQVHECLEDHKKVTTLALKRLSKDAEVVRSDVSELKEALGLGEKKRRTIATQTPFSAYWRSVMAWITGFGGVIFILKFSYFAAPGMGKVVIALWKAVVEGIF